MRMRYPGVRLIIGSETTRQRHANNLRLYRKGNKDHRQLPMEFLRADTQLSDEYHAAPIYIRVTTKAA